MNKNMILVGLVGLVGLAGLGVATAAGLVVATANEDIKKEVDEYINKSEQYRKDLEKEAEVYAEDINKKTQEAIAKGDVNNEFNSNRKAEVFRKRNTSNRTWIYTKWWLLVRCSTQIKKIPNVGDFLYCIKTCISNKRI